MKSTLLKTALGGGALTALLCFLFIFSLDLLNLNPFGKYKFLYFPIYVGGISLTIRYFRDRLNEGILNGSRAVALAMIINIVAAGLYALFLWTFLRVDGGILEQHKAELLQWVQVRQAELTEQLGAEAYQQALKVPATVTVGSLVFDEWLKTSGIGMFFAFIIALLLKRNTKPNKV